MDEGCWLDHVTVRLEVRGHGDDLVREQGGRQSKSEGGGVTAPGI